MQQGFFPSGEESCTMFCFPCELAQTMSEQLWPNSGRSLGHEDLKLKILGTDRPLIHARYQEPCNPQVLQWWCPSLSFSNQDVLAGCGGTGKESKQMLVSCTQEVISRLNTRSKFAGKCYTRECQGGHAVLSQPILIGAVPACSSPASTAASLEVQMECPQNSPQAIRKGGSFFISVLLHCNEAKRPALGLSVSHPSITPQLIDSSLLFFQKHSINSWETNCISPKFSQLG